MLECKTAVKIVECKLVPCVSFICQLVEFENTVYEW